MPLQPRRSLLRVEESEDLALVQVVSEELGEDQIQEVGSELLAVADRLAHGQLRVDLGKVRYLTSTALATFVNLHRRLGNRGGHLVLSNVRDVVYEIFEVTCLHQVLDVRRWRPDSQSPQPA